MTRPWDIMFWLALFPIILVQVNKCMAFYYFFYQFVIFICYVQIKLIKAKP